MVYHGVAERVIPGLNSRFIPLARFREHAHHLHRCYQVVTLQQIFEEEYDKTRLAIALTFDDGLVNNLRYVLPVLEQFNLPATFFVTAIPGVNRDILWPDLLDMTAHTGPDEFEFKGHRWQKRKGKYTSLRIGMGLQKLALTQSDPAFIPELEKVLEKHGRFRHQPDLEPCWRVMTAPEIQQMAACPLAEIGSHGTRHYNLATLEAAAGEEDMRFAKQWLETTVGKETDAIAFPVGQYTPAVRDAALRLGYKRLLLDSFFSREDSLNPCMKDRFGVHPALPASLQWHYLNRGHY
jgi:peptidoglycan/xylan/chitin deacetylase (PgdA/CDA1 family)